MSEHKCSYCGSDAGCDCAERIACKKAGSIGHFQCGVCFDHNKPRFLCGCLLTQQEKRGG